MARGKQKTAVAVKFLWPASSAMEGEPIMRVFRAMRTSLFLAGAAPLMLCGQQNAQGDLPRPNPGTSNPDLQQQQAPKKGNKGAQSNDSNSGSAQEPSQDSTQNNAQNNGDSSSKKSKKKHNQQTHGPQRHDPNGHS